MNPRIFNELKSLYGIFKNINMVEVSNNKSQITIKDNFDDLKNSNNIITIMNTNNIITVKGNIIYTFTVLSTYPFTMPILKINNIPYTNILKIIPRYSPILNKYYGHDCLCCGSLNCINNWNPQQFLIKIIDEFKETLIIKKRVVILYFCQIIKQKNNCEFAEIEQYL